jgi:predicted P-loop ATPase
MKIINIRVPFGKNEAHLIRRCSFVGSTNEQTFLADETGSVRWLCFNINGFDFNYKNNCNIDNIWSQAFALYKSTTNRNQWDMTKQEIELNEKHNKQFKIASVEQDLICKYFQPSNKLEGQFYTSTDILVFLKPLNIYLNNIAIGRALKTLGFEREKFNNSYGYWLQKKLDILNNFQ